MIARIFLTLCFAMITCAPLRGDDVAIKISLGIRDARFPGITNMAFPLAFTIENTGKAVIDAHQIPALFFKGILHVLPQEGKEQETKLQRMWRTSIHDVAPGKTFESPVVGNVLSFFPTLKDGVYQVWWTLGDLKSNVLNFTVTNGKIMRNDPKA